MKKIIIVNNNMKVGGVQKSLCNLLWALEEKRLYDVTLVLFSPVGEYMDTIPPSVKCIYLKSLFRYLGVSQGEMRGIDVLKRGALAAICRIFGRAAAIKIMLLGQPVLPGTYDCAISYLHSGKHNSFYGGVQDFVLHRIRSAKKVAFLHCDYRACGGDNPNNNHTMEMFDRIAACSDGCRRVFTQTLPHLTKKCMTVRNCHRHDEILELAGETPAVYGTARLNVITVARLSHEKGIERAIDAAAYCVAKGIPLVLHVVGDGNRKAALCERVAQLNLEDHVVFYGEQSNPYRLMAGADLFLLTSYHEAAPMVIDEAYILGVPTLTTRTNSSDEMVTARNCGWVCENSQEALNQALAEILQNEAQLKEMKKRLCEQPVDNTKALSQFFDLIEG